MTAWFNVTADVFIGWHPFQTSGSGIQKNPHDLTRF